MEDLASDPLAYTLKVCVGEMATLSHWLRLTILSAMTALACACSSTSESDSEDEGMAEDALRTVDDEVPVGTTMITRGDGLRLRTAASLDAPVLRLLRKGTRVQVTEAAPVDGFRHISVGSQTGWSFGAYLDAVDPERPSKDDKVGSSSSPSPSRGSCEYARATVELKAWGSMRLPRLARVVREAHYVVEGDDDFPLGRWPSSSTDGIREHLGRSCSLLHSKYVSFFPKLTPDCSEIYDRGGARVWTPAEGGGNRGQGSSKRPPVEHEMWQGNLPWKNGSAPRPGTRFIFRNPAKGRSVVVAMGYEVGPMRDGNDFMAGVTSEASAYLGHDNGKLEFGPAADPSLPFGPIDCD